MVLIVALELFPFAHSTNQMLLFTILETTDWCEAEQYLHICFLICHFFIYMYIMIVIVLRLGPATKFDAVKLSQR